MSTVIHAIKNPSRNPKTSFAKNMLNSDTTTDDEHSKIISSTQPVCTSASLSDFLVAASSICEVPIVKKRRTITRDNIETSGKVLSSLITLQSSFRSSSDVETSTEDSDSQHSEDLRETTTYRRTTTEFDSNGRSATSDSDGDSPTAASKSSR